MNLSVNVDKLKGFLSVGYHFGYPVIFFYQKSIYSEKKIKSFFLVLKSFENIQKRITNWKKDNQLLTPQILLNKG